ncbi:MAG: hypothetical protein ACRC14_04865, partial [Paracoccaceae bacterium]
TQGAAPGSLKTEVVTEVLKREPELITDVLLAALRKEIRPLKGLDMEAHVQRDKAMKALKAAAEPDAAGSSNADDNLLEIERLQHEIDRAALARLTSSPTACYVIGLGAEPEHILAIADSYQTKSMDALSRELLNFTVKKVARLDANLKDGAYEKA